MLVLALTLGLTALLLRNAVRWRNSRTPYLGAVSDQWIAAFNTSSRASSF
jgi:hypothetical protein